MANNIKKVAIEILGESRKKDNMLKKLDGEMRKFSWQLRLKELLQKAI